VYPGGPGSGGTLSSRGTMGQLTIDAAAGRHKLPS
jgi:hypothetical protein